MYKNQKVVLIILDGWGIGPEYPGNAIDIAETPIMDRLWISFPHTQLGASGESVGLPKGEDGNTETGHLNIGAGRIVYQDLPRINMSIANGAFFNNEAFLKADKHAKDNNSNLHIIGLIGSGGVHSSNQHLYALLQFCKQQRTERVFLHLITDGRDSPPTSAIQYIQDVKSEIEKYPNVKIATVIGRYYAMDRDHRAERTKVAYDALVLGEGVTIAEDLEKTINEMYQKNITDEFLTPIVPLIDGVSPPRITSNDAAIFFNYRIDRPRQLTKALVLSDKELAELQESFDPYAIKYEKKHQASKPKSHDTFIRRNRPENFFFVTMTEYEKNLPVEIAFPPEFVQMPLSRVIALNGKRQLKLAESEKERFVTYYFNGQREEPFPGEDIKITDSPKVATYDLQPEMSGEEQTKKLISAIQSELYHLIVINYANPDMVAHTGNLEATIKACEYTDKWIGRIYMAISQRDDVTMVITADHGNAEELINLETQQTDTEHSNLPVPLIVVGKMFLGKRTPLKKGVLGDIAPTILELMGIQKPSSMTGRSLF